MLRDDEHSKETLGYWWKGSGQDLVEFEEFLFKLSRSEEITVSEDTVSVVEKGSPNMSDAIMEEIEDVLVSQFIYDDNDTSTYAA